MRKLLLVVLFLLGFLILFFFFPGKFENRIYNSACDAKCNSDNSNVSQEDKLKRFLECYPPIDGFSVFCLGFSKMNSCSNGAGCFYWCDNTCYGLVSGSGAAPSPIEAKVAFIKNLLRRYD